MSQPPPALPDFNAILTSLGERVPRPPGPDRSLSLAERLAVVEEMLRALDTLPPGGQQYAMDKIAAFLHEQAGKLPRPLDDRRMVLVQRAEALRAEARRTLPDVATFRTAAGEILALLDKATSATPSREAAPRAPGQRSGASR